MPMTESQRPLSPHLTIYRPQWTSVLSIAHRISGMALGVGALLMVVWLLIVANGQGDSYAQLQGLASHPLSQVVAGLLVFALSYHLLNGIRHLLWDAGVGLELESARRSAALTVLGTVLLTALTMWAIHRGG